MTGHAPAGRGQRYSK